MTPPSSSSMLSEPGLLIVAFNGNILKQDGIFHDRENLVAAVLHSLKEFHRAAQFGEQLCRMTITFDHTEYVVAVKGEASQMQANTIHIIRRNVDWQFPVTLVNNCRVEGSGTGVGGCSSSGSGEGIAVPPTVSSSSYSNSSSGMASMTGE